MRRIEGAILVVVLALSCYRAQAGQSRMVRRAMFDKRVSGPLRGAW